MTNARWESGNFILTVGVGLGTILVIPSENLIQNQPCTYKFATQPNYIRE